MENNCVNKSRFSQIQWVISQIKGVTDLVSYYADSVSKSRATLTDSVSHNLL